MVNYARYSLENDLYATFVASSVFDDAVARIRTRRIKQAIGKHGIADKIAADGSYDFESGELLINTGLSADSMSSAAYKAVCEVAEAYAEFVVNHHRNPRNAGRPPLGDKPKIRTTISIDPGLKDRAQAANINMSAALEEKLRELLD